MRAGAKLVARAFGGCVPQSLLEMLGGYSFELIAPINEGLPFCFRCPAHDEAAREELLHASQRLRGRVYELENAITSGHLTPDGRYSVSSDFQSWHIVLLKPDRTVVGAMRVKFHGPTLLFSECDLRHASILRSQEWGAQTKAAIEQTIALAQQHGLLYAEVGGWVLAESSRYTSKSLMLALATYALCELMGGSLILAYATIRNNSASILMRIGGTAVPCATPVLPSYFDRDYGCEMVLLRFDSRTVPAKYARFVRMLQVYLRDTNVYVTTKAGTQADVSCIGGTRNEPAFHSRAAAACSLRSDMLNETDRANGLNRRRD